MTNEKNRPPMNPAPGEGAPQEDLEDSGAWPRDNGPLQLPDLAPMPPTKGALDD